MLVDTHCHINYMIKTDILEPITPKDLLIANNIATDANNIQIKYILEIGTSWQESQNAVDIAENIDSVFAALAIHPDQIHPGWESGFNFIKNLLKNRPKKIRAIGETGLDYYRPGFNLELQQKAFKAHIELALENDLPLSIHTRAAQDGVLKILSQYKCPELRGSIHCFSEDIKFAETAINLGFVLGIGGTITYPKNNSLRDVVKSVGLENIVLETDAPFLPIQAMRGKQNHPMHIKDIAIYLATLFETDFQNIALATTNNANKIFKFF